MSDHADSGEYGLHTNWENCEGGLCCDEALAIMKALVAERDAWKVEALHHNAEEIRLREALVEIQGCIEDHRLGRTSWSEHRDEIDRIAGDALAAPDTEETR